MLTKVSNPGNNKKGGFILIGVEHTVICEPIHSLEFLRELQLLSYDASAFILIQRISLCEIGRCMVLHECTLSTRIDPKGPYIKKVLLGGGGGGAHI